MDLLVATTHPALIAIVGGDEKAREVLPKAMQAEFDALSKAGFKVTAFDVGEPENVRTEGEWTFVLVPTTLVAEGPKGKVTAKSHTLATRKAGDPKWSLLRLGFPEEKVRQLIPELPKDYALPARQQPQIEPK